MKSLLIEKLPSPNKFILDSDEKPYVIGRNRQTDIRTPQIPQLRDISSFHALMKYDYKKELWELYDLNSTRGTYVNSLDENGEYAQEEGKKIWKKVENMHTLKNKDNIRLGNKYVLEFFSTENIGNLLSDYNPKNFPETIGIGSKLEEELE
jgi:pSer/pThr/pTyr-binding forkhead associated (FHA) protein